MKVDVSMFGEKSDGKDAPAVPMPLYRMVQWMVQTLSVIMRTFGIAELRLELTPSGMIPVTTIRFQPMPGMDLPKDLADIRSAVMRNMLASGMERFGIGMIKLTLSEEEKTELREYWSFLLTGVPPPAAPTAKNEDIIFNNLPLPVETDPDAAEPPAQNTASMLTGPDKAAGDAT